MALQVLTMKIDIVIATYNRADCVVAAIESCLQYKQDFGYLYVVVNGSTDDTMQKLAVFDQDSQVVIIELDKNYGAPAGKNVGLRKSSAEIVVVIDDDAEFFSVQPINEVRRMFEADATLGIVQFKIVNAELGKVLKYEFPAGDPAANADKVFKVGTFTGAGHAMRKQMLDDVGYYDDEFFYAHEELDLSFRAINGGWIIKYMPAVGVIHKKNPQGRLPMKSVIGKMFLNRLVINRRYLPFIYRTSACVLWFMKTAVWARGIGVAVATLRQYLTLRSGIRRQPLTPAALAYLRKNYGRLWY